MGKSEHSKKLKRQEKAKVKLKIGKRLPKGQNVTNTNFKTQKIIIHEQLRTNRNEPVTNRKLNLKTLLSYLKHHNVNVQRDSLIGLKELLLQNPEVITVSLGPIIETLSELIVDGEGKIRKMASSIIKVVLKQVSSQQLSPFFPVLTAHLCSSMTHISPAVQQDSLLLLDVLLDTFPSFITAVANHILPNFLNQISKKISDDGVKAVTAVSPRLLVVNLEQKITNLRWRTYVLKKLHKFLQVLIHEPKNQFLPASDDKITVTWTKTNQTYVSLYTFSGCTPIVQQGFTLKQEDRKSSGKEHFLRQSSQVKEFVTSLMPLLIETWVEASPEIRTKHSPGNILSCDGVEVLDCVLEIIHLLWKLICTWEIEEKQYILSPWFKATYHYDIISHFLQWFPFAQHKDGKRRKSKCGIDGQKLEEIDIEDEEKLKCENQNLSICYIFSFMAMEQDKEQAEKVMKYVLGILQDSNPDAVDLRKLMMVLEGIFLEANSEVFTCGSVSFNELLNATVQHYNQLHPLKKERTMLIQLLTDMILDDSLQHLHRLSSLTSWLTFLPDLLCQENIPATALRAMQKVACQKNFLFLDTIRKKLPKILENFPYLKTEDCHNQDAQKTVIELIYRLPNWDRDMMETLKKYCEKEEIPADVSSYLRKLIKCKDVWYVKELLD